MHFHGTGKKDEERKKYNFIYHIDHISFDFSFTVILKPFYIIINNSWWLQMLNVFEHEHANHSNWAENANNRFIIDIFFSFWFRILWTDQEKYAHCRLFIIITI